MLTARRSRLALTTAALLSTMVVTPPSHGRVEIPLPTPSIVGCLGNDNGDPVLTALEIVPSGVDVTSGPAVVTIVAHAQDTGGPGSAKGVGGVGISLEPDSGGHYESTLLKPAAAGAWTGSVTIPQGASPGNWSAYVGVSERNHDSQLSTGTTSYDASQLATLGFDSHITVKSDQPDLAPPSLTNFTFTPRNVDTRRHPVRMTFKATVVDTGTSGVADFAWAYVSNAYLDLNVNLDRIPGTNTFKGVLDFPTNVGNKPWRVDSVTIQDKVSNFDTVRYGQLGLMGFPEDFTVTSHASRTPQILGVRRTPKVADARDGKATIHVAMHVKNVSKAGTISLRYSSSRVYADVGSELKLVRGNRRNGTWAATVKMPACKAVAGVWNASVWLSDFPTRGVTMQLNRRTGLPAGITLRARDHVVPVAGIGAVTPTTATIHFNEPVHGVSTTSIHVSLSANPADVNDGTWQCNNASGSIVSCLTGSVMTATFAASKTFSPGARYRVLINPEHILAVRDQSGNPLWRTQLEFQT